MRAPNNELFSNALLQATIPGRAFVSGSFSFNVCIIVRIKEYNYVLSHVVFGSLFLFTCFPPLSSSLTHTSLLPAHLPPSLPPSLTPSPSLPSLPAFPPSLFKALNEGIPVIKHRLQSFGASQSEVTVICPNSIPEHEMELGHNIVADMLHKHPEGTYVYI